MLFVIRFTDRPDSLALRTELLPAHLAWLAEHRDSILVAGSLRSEPDAPPVGSCWIVEAPDSDSARAIVARDPFWTAGLRDHVEVLHFSPAPGSLLG